MISIVKEIKLLSWKHIDNVDSSEYIVKYLQKCLGKVRGRSREKGVVSGSEEISMNAKTPQIIHSASIIFNYSLRNCERNHLELPKLAQIGHSISNYQQIKKSSNRYFKVVQASQIKTSI